MSCHLARQLQGGGFAEVGGLKQAVLPEAKIS